MNYYVELTNKFGFIYQGKLYPIDEHGNFTDEDGDPDHYLQWEDETGYRVEL